jgi:hypothetical protein
MRRTADDHLENLHSSKMCTARKCAQYFSARAECQRAGGVSRAIVTLGVAR